MSDFACREIRELLGVYVVGAIEPADRAVMEEHLGGCRRCREELAGLAPLPALLRRVPLADAQQIAMTAGPEAGAQLPEPGEAGARLPVLLDAVAVRRRSRRMRAVLAAAAAVLIAAGGSAAVSHELRPSAPSTPWAASDHSVGTNSRLHLTAWVSYHNVNWGTALWARVAGIKPGTTCTLWVMSKDGHRYADGSWTVEPGSSQVWYPTATSVRRSQLAGFQITASGKVLVTVPAGA